MKKWSQTARNCKACNYFYMLQWAKRRDEWVEIKIWKRREDRELTGCPVTRTRQLHLDQLIPALGVHLHLQLEGWLFKKTKKNPKTPTQRRKVFLFTQVLSLPLCSVPQTLKRTDGEHYDASTGSCNLHICSAGHAFLLFRLGACGGRRIRRLAAVVMVRVGGFVHGCG